MKLIRYPRGCNVQEVFKFCSIIAGCKDEEKLTIDFSQMGRVEPFTIVYVARFIRDFNRRNKEIQIICIGYQDKDYAANMGFFRAFGLKHGREPNSVDGNDRFVPFTILRIQSIVDEATLEWTAEQDIIEKRSRHLAKILSQEDKGDLYRALSLSICELLRNVYEHSESKSIEYCAQYWPTYNRVEIAIVDNGKGLKASLEDNPYIEIENHRDSIEQSLMPAISSKSYKGSVNNNSNDSWQNIGFGLYMINRICRLGGSFIICSGDHAIKLDGSVKEHIELPHICRGTAIRIVLDLNRLIALDASIDQFKEEGFHLAKQIKGVNMYEASTASQMLSRDFKL